MIANFRMYSGLFTAPSVEFPKKKEEPTEDEMAHYGGLVRDGDLFTDAAFVHGTKYHVGQIVVTAASCSDIATVGVIVQPVIRKDQLLFICTLHDAIQTPFGFWQACPLDQLVVINKKKLFDFKPHYKRDSNICFRFLLHHKLSCKVEDGDGEAE